MAIRKASCGTDGGTHATRAKLPGADMAVGGVSTGGPLESTSDLLSKFKYTWAMH